MVVFDTLCTAPEKLYLQIDINEKSWYTDWIHIGIPT